MAGVLKMASGLRLSPWCICRRSLTPALESRVGLRSAMLAGTRVLSRARAFKARSTRLTQPWRCRRGASATLVVGYAITGMVAALLILSSNSVVAGWSLDYHHRYGPWAKFVGIDGDSAGARFGGLTADPWRLDAVATVLFMAGPGSIIAARVGGAGEESCGS